MQAEYERIIFIITEFDTEDVITTSGGLLPTVPSTDPTSSTESDDELENRYGDYDNIGSGDNYSLIKPTTLFCITDLGLIPKAPKEFYAKYRLTNLKNHHLYTDKFGINVLQLNHTDLATEEDISNNLVYWANLFKATTWEEFKKLAKNHPDIEEVGNMIFELNYDNQAKEILEGQRRYREQMNSQYTAGYTDAEEKYETMIAEKDNMLSEKDATIAQKDDMLSEKDATIANKDSEIAQLRAELEKYKNRNT